MKTWCLVKSNRSSVASVVLVIIGTFCVAAYGQTRNVSLINAASGTAAPAPRKIFVRSTALLVSAEVVENKLMKRSEFNQLGLTHP